jgi:hypothetical protein
VKSIFIATTLVVLFCGVNATFAQTQIVCEMPNFMGQRMLAPHCWPTSEVSGSVLGVDLSTGTVHVSLSALSFNKFFEVSVDDSGSFKVNAVPAGEYELYATQRGRILGFTRVLVSPVNSQLIFQSSNEKRIIGPGLLRPVQVSEQIGKATFPWGLVDWPRLHGPRCVRSKCYVDAMDEVSQ